MDLINWQLIEITPGADHKADGRDSGQAPGSDGGGRRVDGIKELVGGWPSGFRGK